MSYIKNISLTQFRNYNLASFSFFAPVVGITGANGVGKTNLLDSIYYACFTKSYFQSRELNITQQGFDGFRLEAEFELSNVKETEHVNIVWREGKKKITENGVMVERITDFIGKYTALMIAPDDIELINGSSEVRRKFIDGILSQTDKNYLEKLLQYQKVLIQRNAYLKQTAYNAIHADLLDIYDEQLSNYAAYILQKRQEFSKELPDLVKGYYLQLADHNETIAIHYKMTCEPEQIKSVLKYNRNRDIEARRTTAGIHTEDWILSLGNNIFKTHASQGQKKSLLISMKMAQFSWMQKLGKSPILLLDDIFDKLDKKRLCRLFEVLKAASVSQIFMTHTEAAVLKEMAAQYFHQVQMITVE